MCHKKRTIVFRILVIIAWQNQRLLTRDAFIRMNYFLTLTWNNIFGLLSKGFRVFPPFQQVDAIDHQQCNLHHIQRDGGEVGVFQRQVMQSMQDDGEPDGVRAQADGTQPNAMNESSDHLGKDDKGISIEQVTDVHHTEQQGGEYESTIVDCMDWIAAAGGSALQPGGRQAT